ncbi:uncharacterized protein LOC124456651 [Xenia sp. Carnegie-2017]|uniref:uncharacterized protein LOC124456651 n=1 Tax=Xenia sp. Carnegie-2017 TaxID=2897299 RepID=UPI001F03A878|nr:uncharacterized protein LOC124456651 [Xenia sp. Carnegie-2017]
MAGIARLATRRGCRAGASKQRPIPTIQGYSRYSGDSSQFQFRHLSFQNDYYSPFMQISSNLFDRDFHNNMLINLLTSSATQAHNSSTLDRQIPRHSSGSISTCSFGLINCRSVCNKTLVVKDLVVDKDIDILGITETWLRGNDLDNPVLAELVPSGYSFGHSVRHDSRGGGVGQMFKKSLNVNPPPSSENRVSCESFLDEFGTLLENCVIDPRPLLITDDFNFHVDNKSDVDANNFSDLLESFNLCQHVMESTHCAGHTMDLIISRNSENILNSLNVVDVPISDHRLIICSLDLKKPPFEKRRIQYRQLISVNYDNFRKDVMNSPFGPEVQHAPVDSSMNPFEVASHLVDLYDNVLLSLIDSCAPVKTKTIILRPRAAWYSNGIAECKKRRRRLERKWRRTRLLCDRVNYEKQCAECRDLIYKTKKDYFNTVISENIHDQRVFFQTVNHLLSGGIKDTEYPTCSDDKTLAEVFINFFTSKINVILSDLQRSGISDTLKVSSQCKSTFLNFDIVTSVEICKLIKSSVKSCSLDPVPLFLFKKCSDILVPFLTRMVNHCLTNGIMPDALKIARITPILKKSGADCEQLKNFRPVSNLKFISKLMEKCVAVQLNQYLNDNCLLEEFQSAYKIAYSTETALLKIQSDILMSLDNGKAVVLVFLHMSAAFDTVRESQDLAVKTV